MNRKFVLSLFVIGCLAVTPVFAAQKTAKKLSTKTTTSAKTRVYNDATRLAALLRDAQTTVTVNSDVWRTVANEANSLANRLYGATGGSKTARDAARNARTHVRAFRDAAMSGDAAGAREHANEAMQFVAQLIDWSAPAQT